MAATSHDFWLANLTAPIWKALHMLVYVAYALLVLHVTFGVLQGEGSPVYVGATALGLVTVLGLQFGTLLAGAVITEVVFSWPGIGSLLVTSILNRDFPIVQATLLVVSLTFLLVNLVTDLLYFGIDPRIRVE